MICPNGWEWIDNRRIKNVKTQTCVAPIALNSYASCKLVDCDQVQHAWDCAVTNNIAAEGLIYDKRLLMAKMNNSLPNNLFVVDPAKDDLDWVPKRITQLHTADMDNINARACLFRPSSNCPPLPQIANGNVEKHCKGSIAVPGTICNYICNDGYLLQGLAKKQCQESGEWTNTAEVQCKVACPPLHVPNFSAVTPKSCGHEQKAEGASCIFECDAGFSLTGSSKRFCQLDGAWSGLPTICHRPCLPFKIPPYLTLSPPTCGTSNQTLGTICTASCPFGYSLVGSFMSVCQYNGMWSGTISGCQRSCEALKDIPNGRIFPSNCSKPVNYAGATCIVSCNAHYGLIGNRIRTCTENGLWSGWQTEMFKEM